VVLHHTGAEPDSGMSVRRHEARSAGSRPAEDVHPPVVEGMGEIGVDVRGNVPLKLNEDDM
jgi:protein-tyrosine-phosphatase